MTASAETPQAEWKLVPVEPTAEMRVLGAHVHDQRPSEAAAVYHAMLAASPAATATPQVKPLEWRVTSEVSHTATAIGLRYYVYLNNGDGLWHAYTDGYQPAQFGEFGEIHAAKAAAQADYERRINSALVTSDDRTALLARIAELEKARDDERMHWFLSIISAVGGSSDASDYKHNWVNAFCADFEGRDDDTFNRAADAGYTTVSHDTSFDESTVRLTDKGRAFIATLAGAQS